MTKAEAAMMRALETNANAFDSFFDQSADAPPMAITPGGAELTKTKGNPTFSAQFDINFIKLYFTLTGGAYTQIAAAGLNAGLKNSLPHFLFGLSDYKAGFAKLRNSFPVVGWAYGRPGIYGKDSFDEYAFDAAITANLQQGDMVVPFTSALPGAGTTSLALCIIRCTQVAYGTLLESLVSDRFVMNMIRYVVADSTAAQLAQYANNIGMFNQSLFGKFDSDFISPNSFKKPEQQQSNLIDIPLKKGINKEVALALSSNYDVVGYTWSTFVWSVAKHTN